MSYSLTVSIQKDSLNGINFENNSGSWRNLKKFSNIILVKRKNLDSELLDNFRKHSWKVPILKLLVQFLEFLVLYFILLKGLLRNHEIMKTGLKY